MCLPFHDQIVATVAAESTYSKPVINLGKVLGFDLERKTVKLAELVHCGNPTCFKMEIGSMTVERLSEIVHTIDVVYVERDNTYILRTPRREINQFACSYSDTEKDEEP